MKALIVAVLLSLVVVSVAQAESVETIEVRVQWAQSDIVSLSLQRSNMQKQIAALQKQVKGFDKEIARQKKGLKQLNGLLSDARENEKHTGFVSYLQRKLLGQ